MGSQLKKLRRALPPPPGRSNLSVSFPVQPGVAPYLFRVDPAPRVGEDPRVVVTAPPGVEVGPVEVIATPNPNTPTAPSEAFKPAEPAMRRRAPANKLHTLLALSMLAGLATMPRGRDGG